MNRRAISKTFNEVPIGEWADIVPERIKLTNGAFPNSEESRMEINRHIEKYNEVFFSTAILKKVVGSKTIVTWPVDGNTLFKPVVDRVEVFRVSKAKYVMLIQVEHVD